MWRIARSAGRNEASGEGGRVLGTRRGDAYVIIAAYMLPNNTVLLRWGIVGSSYSIERFALPVLSGHLGYSLAVYARRGRAARDRRVTTWADVLAGTLVAEQNEGGVRFVSRVRVL